MRRRVQVDWSFHRAAVQRGRKNDLIGVLAVAVALRSHARRLLLFVASSLIPLSSFASSADRQVVLIDASRPDRTPGPARYDAGSSRSPAGDEIGLNSRYLTFNGKPWIPVMGEFHFSRYPRARWEEEILKMKASGVEVIATYVIWIHHEEIRGQFDWAGQRDLRAFAQLCARRGMYLVVRIGPWAHGEVRNGGFPDWVVQQGHTRQNDPFYLQAVRTWYAEMGRQVNGLLWKDGGPIIGVQLENEYAARGQNAGEAHILMLKKLAREAGFDVPLYTVTGWDNAVVPQRAVLPVYGGYPDAPWDASLTDWKTPELYAFRTRTRVAADLPADSTLQDPVPFLTAELGAGNEPTYHRRPILKPDDVAATVPVMLGSGVNLLGTYMFQGGENPDGRLTTLQESQTTGYPNDVPLKSYDFQAPLGEFGEERASFRKLKVFQYFLNDFGADLAPMAVAPAAVQPKTPADLGPIRASVRVHSGSGFLFVNNHVRHAQMPARPAVQFEIRIPEQVLTLPSHPIDIPSGAYFIWPFNLRVEGIGIRYATAQLFTRLRSPGGNTLVFEAQRGIPVDFAFDAGTKVESASSGGVSHQAGITLLEGIEPGLNSSIELSGPSGAHVRILVFTAEEAENAWKIHTSGTDRLLITPQDFFSDDTQPVRACLQSRGAPQFDFTLLPAPPSDPHATLPLTRVRTSAQMAHFAARADAVEPAIRVDQIQPAAEADPIRLGPPRAPAGQRVAEAPSGSAFQHAAQWQITLPAIATNAMDELFLRIRYTGDVARLYGSGNLLDDNFYNGAPWDVGLSRFLDLRKSNRLALDILPLRQDAPIYIETDHRPAFNGARQVVSLDSVELVPQYRLEVDLP